MSKNIKTSESLLFAYLRQIGISEDKITPIAKSVESLVKSELSRSFKEAVGDTFPEKAPELFIDRKDRSEKPPQFIQRVYGQWLTGAFTRADLRKLDMSLIQMLYRWERNNAPFTSLPANPYNRVAEYEPKPPKTKDEKALLDEERERALAEERTKMRASFPQKAPELYAEREDKNEKAPHFIARVYEKWLTGEFNRVDLAKLDPSARSALDRWEQIHGTSQINLPSKYKRYMPTKKDTIGKDREPS